MSGAPRFLREAISAHPVLDEVGPVYLLYQVPTTRGLSPRIPLIINTVGEGEIERSIDAASMALSQYEYERSNVYIVQNSCMCDVQNVGLCEIRVSDRVSMLHKVWTIASPKEVSAILGKRYHSYWLRDFLAGHKLFWDVSRQSTSLVFRLV